LNQHGGGLGRHLPGAHCEHRSAAAFAQPAMVCERASERSETAEIAIHTHTNEGNLY
jgi:hypothetical protein